MCIMSVRLGGVPHVSQARIITESIYLDQTPQMIPTRGYSPVTEVNSGTLLELRLISVFAQLERESHAILHLCLLGVRCWSESVEDVVNYRSVRFSSLLHSPTLLNFGLITTLSA